MTRLPRPLLLLVPLFFGVAGGCAANSDRSYRGHAVAAGDPWPVLVARVTGGGRPGPRETNAGLRQLEDLVEGAASVVFGSDVDFPTPKLRAHQRFLTVVEVVAGAPRTLPLPAWLGDADTFGVKYVVDHVGPDDLEGFTAEARVAALALADGVAAHVYGSLPAEAGLPAVRRAEERLAARLGLTPAALVDNPRRYDTSVWTRSAFTTPPGLLRGVRIHLDEELLAADPGLQSFVYAHELFHALLFEEVPGGVPSRAPAAFARAGPQAAPVALERVRMEELSAQVFAVRVLRELARDALLPGLCDVDLAALPGDPVRGPGRDPWERLAALYREPRASPSRDLIAGRYGYDGRSDDLATIAAGMDAWGVEGYARRLTGFRGWSDLRAALAAGERGVSAD